MTTSGELLVPTGTLCSRSPLPGGGLETILPGLSRIPFLAPRLLQGSNFSSVGEKAPAESPLAGGSHEAFLCCGFLCA